MAAFPEIAAFLPVDPHSVLPAIGERAQELGAEVLPLADGPRILAFSGVIAARAEGTGLRLIVQAREIADLDMLREAIGRFAAAGGLPAPARTGGLRPAGGRRLTLARVVHARRISPSHIRVRLAGDFGTFAHEGGRVAEWCAAARPAARLGGGGDGDLRARSAARPRASRVGPLPLLCR